MRFGAQGIRQPYKFRAKALLHSALLAVKANKDRTTQDTHLEKQQS